MARSSPRVRTSLVFLLVAVFLLLLSSTALAGLAAVGPVKPDPPGQGFPRWYQDPDGVAVEIGFDPALDIIDPVDPTNPTSVAAGFGPEAFYFLAETSFDFSAQGALEDDGGALLVLALEAAWGQEEPEPNQQMVFNRVRFRMDVPVAGTYVLRHPYGTQTFVVSPEEVGIRGINFTEDVGAAPLLFEGALAGQIGPFLRQVVPAGVTLPPDRLGLGPSALEDYPVTGSPVGQNFFEVQAPTGVDLDPAVAGIQRTRRITTFMVEGKIFTGAAFRIDRASYTRNDTSGQVEVWVTSNTTGATFDVTSPGLPTPLTMVGDGTGRFFVSFPLANPGTVPATVTVTANRGTESEGAQTETVKDVVVVTRADFNAATNNLTIEARSTDTRAGGPALTATGIGALTGGARTVNRLVPPVSVEVTSARGGTDVEPVIIQATSSATEAVDDSATTPVNTPVVIDVLANDRAATGTTLDPATVTVASGPASGQTDVNATTGEITYTPDADFTGTDTFTYTVADSTGTISNAATVTVTVTPPPPPGATVSGTVTEGGTAVSGVLITLAQAGSPNQTFTTGADGTFSFAGIQDGTITVTPSQAGRTFTPASRTVNVAGADVTGVDFARNPPATTAAISGTVRSVNGTARAGVPVRLQAGTLIRTVSTNAQGVYTFTGLAAGTYTVRAIQSGFTFTPDSRTVTLAGVDQTGQDFTRNDASISGFARTRTGTGLPNVLISVTGAASKTALTNSAGFYTVTALGPGSYTVTPSQSGFTFTPTSRAVVITTSNVTGQNFTRN